MDSSGLFFHLIGFMAPAVAVAVLVAIGARVVMPGRAVSPPWWMQFAINSVVGLLVLAAGLWHFGVDGKMATYAALVTAVASSQWAIHRGWRG